jgi:hypothetical protein
VSEFTPAQQTWLERYIRQIAQQKPAYLVSTDGLLINGATRVLGGTGSPEGAVTAPVGSLFLRDDGSTSTTLYVKTSGAGTTGWTAK